MHLCDYGCVRICEHLQNSSQERVKSIKHNTGVWWGDNLLQANKTLLPPTYLEAQRTEKRQAVLGMQKMFCFSYILTARGGLLLRIWAEPCQLLLALGFKKKLWKPEVGILIKTKFGMALPGVAA